MSDAALATNARASAKAASLDILIISSYYWPETSGNAPYVTGLAEHLAQLGHRVRVVTGFPHYPEWRSTAARALARTEHRNGVVIRRRWHYVPRSQSALTRAVYEATLGSFGATGLPREAPDLILAVTPTLAALTLARAASSLYKRPFGLVFQDLQGPGAAQSGVSGGARIARLVQHAELAGARRAAAVGIIAEGFRSYFVDHGVDPEKIHRLRNWSLGAEPSESVAAARARLGWAEDEFICLHAGNMGHKQGLENVLEAAALLDDTAIRLVLAGSGNAHQALVERASELAIPNVSFLPPQPVGDYEAMLRAADVLLVNQRASVGEMSLASKLTSYFDAGRPVIAAVAPESETAREIQLAEAGVLVEPEDPHALAAALVGAKNDPTGMHALGKRGADYAAKHLGVAPIMRHYEAFLDAVEQSANGGVALHSADRSGDRGAAIPTESDPALTVSCLVVTYQSESTIDACLRSLDAESRDIALEVIVVDNASQDRTVPIIEERHPWASVVVETRNTGFARAANKALRLARGKHILLLNPDTIVSPGLLAAVFAELEQHPEVAVLGCKLTRPDGTFDHACKRGLPSMSSALYYVLGLHRLFPRNRTIAAYTAGHLDENEVGTVDAVNGAFMLVRREAAAMVGGFDERFWLYGEDLDWCQRFAAAGWKILYWPRVEAIHVKGASGRRQRSTRTNFAFHRSMWLYFQKHLAPSHSAPMRAFVWLGIWTRFATAVAGNKLRLEVRAARRDSHPGARS
jgi:colanic acid biosynthesis glycosyl transferase WcaI